VIADVLVGIVPLIGDFLDNLFKSNLRNLALLETWLLTDPSAQMYHILLMPESNDFVPKPKSATRFSTSWFGGGSSTAEDAERERERETGKIRATRRMGRDEGEVKEGKGTRSRADPVHEPVD
jgi:hypothetical protein